MSIVIIKHFFSAKRSDYLTLNTIVITIMQLTVVFLFFVQTNHISEKVEMNSEKVDFQHIFTVWP